MSSTAQAVGSTPSTLPPSASAVASTSTGRNRLLPANRLYRIAPCRGPRIASSGGNAACRASSTRRRRAARYDWRSSGGAAGSGMIIGLDEEAGLSPGLLPDQVDGVDHRPRG